MAAGPGNLTLKHTHPLQHSFEEAGKQVLT